MTLDEVLAKVTDPYERQARLVPALLALLPLLATGALLYGPEASALSAVVGILVSCGGLFLMMNVCRELGKRLQPSLYETWGGTPTTQLLRHRDSTIESVTKRRYHAILAAKINAKFPDPMEEARDPAAADDVYQSGVRWLLDHSRPEDDKRFELLFNENVAYGFRRNALGVKPVGLAVAFGSIVLALVKEDVLLRSSGPPVDLTRLFQLPAPAFVSLIISATMLLVWLFFFTKRTARTAAFTYAEMLLRACDVLK